MSALDRDRAREVLTVPMREQPEAIESVLDMLEECVPLGWDAIWRDLDEIYAEDIFPTRRVSADAGNGPQVVSLLRLLGRAEAKLARIAALCDEAEDSTAGTIGHWQIRAVLSGGVA